MVGAIVATFAACVAAKDVEATITIIARTANVVRFIVILLFAV
jgi:hypothetical protein